MEVPVSNLLRCHQIHQAGYLSSHPGRRLPI
jgi:signal recognition particle subunit SEC65